MVFGGICAAGSGSRVGGEVPKQFLPIKGKPMLMYSVEAFLRVSGIERIYVAVNESWVEYCEKLFADEKRVCVISGGANRAETVEKIVNAVVENGGGDDDIIATHDAARPFVSCELIQRCVKAADKYGVSGAAIAATDTVLRCEGGFITEAPPREKMFLAQTPQCFKVGVFRKVWDSLSEEEKAKATDVCGMMFRAGVSVRIVEGEKNCFKVTTAEELEMAEKLSFEQP